MKILSINTHNPSFGQVRKSAAEIAIEQTKGDMDKLKKVKELVEGQKNNKKVDIVGSSGYRPFRLVHKGCFGHHYTITKCDSLEEACERTDNYLGRNIDNKNSSDKFQALANEILASCKN